MTEFDSPSPAGRGEPGLAASLGRWLELLQLRLTLLGSELEAEKLRLFAGLTGLLLCLVLGGIGLGLLSLALLWLAPEAWRGVFALVLALLYLGAAWCSWRWALRRLSAPSGLFAQSVDELVRDRAALRGEGDV